MQDCALVRWFFKALTPVGVDVGCFVEQGLRLHLVTHRRLTDNRLVWGLVTRGLAHVVAMAGLLDYVALLYLWWPRWTAYLDLLVTDVIVVLVSLHLKLLIALARHAWTLWLSTGEFWRVLVAVHQRTVLLKFDFLDWLPVSCPMTREVFAPRLVSCFVDLGNFLAHSVGLLNKILSDSDANDRNKSINNWPRHLHIRFHLLRSQWLLTISCVEPRWPQCVFSFLMHLLIALSSVWQPLHCFALK